MWKRIKRLFIFEALKKEINQEMSNVVSKPFIEEINRMGAEFSMADSVIISDGFVEPTLELLQMQERSDAIRRVLEL